MHSFMTVSSSTHNYTIEFCQNLSEIVELQAQENTITLIDEKVAELYPSLANGIRILADENSKTLTGAEKILTALSDKKANVNTRLVAIGGGIVQDLAGFCASIYARGIEYIIVPTTLLAQADSCVGGKTSINLNDRKNLIGTFYPPSRILVYTSFLDTLSKKDYLSGLGELYKFAILKGEIHTFNPKGDVERMIKEGLKYKADIIEKDEFDRKERRMLNYGHTFGHALETISNYEIPHGLAVVLGSMIAARVSVLLGKEVKGLTPLLNKGINLIKQSGLTLKEEWFNLEHLLDIVRSDKKSTGKLTMVLLDNEPFLQNVENYVILREALKNTYESI